LAFSISSSANVRACVGPSKSRIIPSLGGESGISCGTFCFLLEKTNMRALVALLTFALFAATYAQAQDASPSPSPAASATPSKRHHKKAKTAETAVANPSPTPTPMASAGPVVNSKKTGSAMSNATPAPGGGNGQVWVNTSSHVYHKEGSRFYGKTKHGKYMSEQDAIKEGDRAAKSGG
jgi:hypothetical protein